MSDNDIPYIIYSSVKKMECNSCNKKIQGRIYLCVCLIDHNIIGSGDNKEEAKQSMIAHYALKYDNNLEYYNDDNIYNDSQDDNIFGEN